MASCSFHPCLHPLILTSRSHTLTRILLARLLIFIICLRAVADLTFPQPPSPGIHVTSQFRLTRYDKGFANIWSPDHEEVSDNQRSVTIFLDQYSGTGFRSNVAYVYGFFSAAVKLPANNYTAGVITTFYMSNAEIYPDKHDEIDFEFLGRIPGEEYVLQTNIFGNGSTNRSREQQFHLWFDPTAEFHNYSILWTPHHILFYVDDIPIREINNVAELDGQYPVKNMYVYATIWDGSDWATDGGRYRADFSYAPFVASYTNLILSGCPSEDEGCLNYKLSPLSRLLPMRLGKEQRESLEWVKSNYMVYNYCDDREKYPIPLSECILR